MYIATNLMFTDRHTVCKCTFAKRCHKNTESKEGSTFSVYGRKERKRMELGRHACWYG